jgi:hypothetical protein
MAAGHPQTITIETEGQRWVLKDHTSVFIALNPSLLVAAQMRGRG